MTLSAWLLATIQLLAAAHARTTTISSGASAAAIVRAAGYLGCHRHRYEPSQYKDAVAVGGGCYKDVLLATPIEPSADNSEVVIQMVRFNESLVTSSDAASPRTGPEGKACPPISSSARRRHLAYQMEVSLTYVAT